MLHDRARTCYISVDPQVCYRHVHRSVTSGTVYRRVIAQVCDSSVVTHACNRCVHTRVTVQLRAVVARPHGGKRTLLATVLSETTL